MNWTLILTILSSSVVAAFFTKFLDIYAANVNYKRDYYKKVIEERLRIYTQLNDVLYQSAGVENHQKKRWFCIFNDSLSTYKFISDISKVADSRIWMSKELGQEVIDLNYFLQTKLEEQNISTASPSFIFQALGISIFDEFNIKRQNIEYLLVKDLSKLHHVKNFFKRQIKYATPDLSK